MLFPNEYYCNCYIIKTNTNGAKPESAACCNQADIWMSKLVNEIKDFFAVCTENSSLARETWRGIRVSVS